MKLFSNSIFVILSLRRTFSRLRRLDYCKPFSGGKVLRKLRMTVEAKKRMPKQLQPQKPLPSESKKPQLAGVEAFCFQN